MQPRSRWTRCCEALLSSRRVRGSAVSCVRSGIPPTRLTGWRGMWRAAINRVDRCALLSAVVIHI